MNETEQEFRFESEGNLTGNHEFKIDYQPIQSQILNKLKSESCEKFFTDSISSLDSN
jgi:hypothetical protein